MKLHRLRLCYFRGVVEREVVFPPTGVIVLEGANEVGKTSMVEALDLLLTEKDSSTKANVRSIKPVGVDAGSEVEAEFSTGPYRLTYRKRWHARPATELTVHAPVREQLTGVPAHERVRSILEETLDDGLWRALRLLQAEPLQQSALSGSTALQAALDTAAGESQDPAAQGSLVEAVEREFLRYHTPTGRPTGSHAQAVQRLSAAEAAAEQAGQDLQEVSRDVDLYAELVADLATLTERRRSQRTELAALEVRWARVEQLDAELRRRARDATSARQLHETAATAWQQRQNAVAELTTRSASRDRRETSSVAQRERVLALGATLEGVEAEVEVLRGQAGQARRAADLARRDAEHLQDAEDVARLVQRIRRVDAALTKIQHARRILATASVTEEAVRAVEAATTALDGALARRSGAAPQVLVEALADVDVEVGGDSVRLRSGGAEQRSAADRLEVHLPGSLRVTVIPGADGHELASTVEAARERLRAALAATGACDLVEARERHRQHRDAEHELAAAGDALAEHLEGEDADALRERLLTWQERWRNHLAGRPERPPLPADVTTARTAATLAETRHAEVRSELDTACARRDSLREQLTTRTVEVVAVESALACERVEVDRAAACLAEVRSTAPDAELAAAAGSTQAGATTAAEAEAAAWAEVDAGDRAVLEVLVDNARAAAERLAAEWDARRLAQARVKGRLESFGAQGRQDRYDEAVTDLQAARREHTAVQRRARAAALLRTVLLAHRDASRRHYVAPFRDTVTALGRVVFGSSFAVEVDDDLRIASRTLEGTTVGYDLLSTGAKEQLAIIIRLACASLVDEADGVPVIIDDALGYSDPVRLSRVAAVFAGAGRTAQVIVLTCTPDRYRSIGSATVVPLSA